MGGYNLSLIFTNRVAKTTSTCHYRRLLDNAYITQSEQTFPPITTAQTAGFSVTALGWATLFVFFSSAYKVCFITNVSATFGCYQTAFTVARMTFGQGGKDKQSVRKGKR